MSCWMILWKQWKLQCLNSWPNLKWVSVFQSLHKICLWVVVCSCCLWQHTWSWGVRSSQWLWMRLWTRTMAMLLLVRTNFCHGVHFLPCTGWILLFVAALGQWDAEFSPSCRSSLRFFGYHTWEKGDGRRVTLNASNTNALRYVELENIFTKFNDRSYLGSEVKATLWASDILTKPTHNVHLR